MEQPLGIFGGTFDPVHLGHLHIALMAQKHLNLAKVKLIPCYQSPARLAPIASPTDRANMIKLAIASYHLLSLDERELMRPQVSYTIETLKSLRHEFPATPLVLIIGSDAFATLTSWHAWRKILDYAHLAVVNRPKTPLSDIGGFLSQYQTLDFLDFHQYLNGRILVIDLAALEISSSQIRKLLREKKDITSLVTKEVAEYIKQHNLYVKSEASNK